MTDIARFLMSHPRLASALVLVGGLGLPDCWVGAGFIRNAVWDMLDGRPVDPAGADVDVVFFAPDDLGPAAERQAEATLRAAAPDLRWSVKNQARMHLRNGDAPYGDTGDAIAHWPETATAVAARHRGDGAADILAPYGLDDLLGFVLRPTPPFRTKLPVFRQRVREKGWLTRWPRLVIME